MARSGGASYWRSEKIERVGERGRCDPRVSPGLSSCARCRTPWAFVDGHPTSYNLNGGCSILCEECWEELSPEERLPFYKVWCEQTRWNETLRLDEVEYPYDQYPSRESRVAELEGMWALIEAAVLAGK